MRSSFFNIISSSYKVQTSLKVDHLHENYYKLGRKYFTCAHASQLLVWRPGRGGMLLMSKACCDSGSPQKQLPYRIGMVETHLGKTLLME